MARVQNCRALACVKNGAEPIAPNHRERGAVPSGLWQRALIGHCIWADHKQS